MVVVADEVAEAAGQRGLEVAALAWEEEAQMRPVEDVAVPRVLVVDVAVPRVLAVDVAVVQMDLEAGVVALVEAVVVQKVLALVAEDREDGGGDEASF